MALKRSLTLIFMLSTYLLALTAPSNLQLSPTETTVTLNWDDNSEEAESFKVFRDGMLIAITAPDTTTYIDTDLTPRTTYTYTIKETDTPIYVLVGDENDAEKRAADVLVNYIRRSTGITATKTSLYQEGEGIYFVVGLDNSYALDYADDVKADNLGDDGFEIANKGDVISIAGATPRGTLYGVYHYLRKYLGWEWYSLDDDGSLTKEINSIVLPEGFERVVPRFVYREVFSPEGGDGNIGADGTPFSLKSYLNGQLGNRYIDVYLKSQDGFGVDFTTVSDILDIPILADEAGAITRVVDGVNYVYGNEDPNSAVGDIYRRPYNDQKEGLLSYGVIKHIDGSSRSSAQEDIDYAIEQESDGAPLFQLAKLSASAVAEDYPDVRILAEAYLWSLKPPKDLHLGSAGVEYAPIEMDWSQSMATGAYNQLYWNYLQEWGNHTDHIVAWLYTTNFQGYLQPLPTIYPMIDTIKQLATQPKVEGVFLQDSYTTHNGSFSALHAWVYAKLLWDPTLDGDALIKEFCQGYYGPNSGDLVYQYIQLLHQSAHDYPSPILTKTNVLQPYLNANFILEADALLMEAESLAEDAWFKKHIQLERLGLEWVILSNNPLLAQEASQTGQTWPYTTQSVWADFNDTIYTVSNISSFLEGGENTFQDMLEGLQIERTIAEKPALCRDIPDSDCVDYQDLGFELADTQNVADANASDNSAAKIAGNTDTWGIQLRLQQLLPEGDSSWDIYAVVKVQKRGEDDTATAFNVGIYDMYQEENVGFSSYTLGDMEENIYMTIQLPGEAYKYNAQQYIWFAPPNSEDIEALYVDRIFAIKR